MVTKRLHTSLICLAKWRLSTPSPPRLQWLSMSTIGRHKVAKTCLVKLCSCKKCRVKAVLLVPCTDLCKLVHWLLRSPHRRVCCWWSPICIKLRVNSFPVCFTCLHVPLLLTLFPSSVTTKTWCLLVKLVSPCWPKVLCKKWWTWLVWLTSLLSKLACLSWTSSMVSALRMKSRRLKCSKLRIWSPSLTNKLSLISATAPSRPSVLWLAVWLKTLKLSLLTAKVATPSTRLCLKL